MTNTRNSPRLRDGGRRFVAAAARSVRFHHGSDEASPSKDGVANEFLAALGLKPIHAQLTCSAATGIADTERVNVELARLQRRPAFTIKRFPSLILADGEKREADCQKPMRYASEYTDDLTREHHEFGLA